MLNASITAYIILNIILKETKKEIKQI